MTDTLLYDVMSGIDKLTNLSVLDFPNNALTDECVDVLTKAMTNKKIKMLNLCNNKISNEGSKNLAIFIANGKSFIEYLDLGLNLVDDDGAITLLKVGALEFFVCAINFYHLFIIITLYFIKLDDRKTAKHLHLTNYAGNIAGQAAQPAEPLLQPADGGELRGCAGPPQTQQTRHRSPVTRQKTITLVSNLISEWPPVQELDLSCNCLTDPGGQTILEGLKYNTSIKKLDIRLTGVGKQVDIAVQNVIRKNNGFKE